MERKKASDYPQELLDLFHEYQHGDITRRDFLERAKKFAVGGVTALALYESLKPNYAWAQQVPEGRRADQDAATRPCRRRRATAASRATSRSRRTRAASCRACWSFTRTAA